MTSRTYVLVTSLALLAACGDDSGNKPADAGIDSPVNYHLELDPATHDYGDVQVGGTSEAATFMVINDGDGPVSVPTLAVTGTDAGMFVASGCGVELPVGGSCSVSVVFRPSETGARTATFSATSPEASASATLTGNGTPPGTLSIAANMTTLGTAVVGATGSTATITVTNGAPIATGPLIVQAGGSEPVDFTRSDDTCSGTAVAAGATCTFKATLSPRSAGTKSVTYQVTGTPGGSISQAISGRGLAPSVLVAEQTRWDVGTIPFGATSEAHTITITNIGDAPSDAITVLSSNALFGMPAGGTCAGTALAGGESCTIKFALSPGASASTLPTIQTGTLVINGGTNGAMRLGLVGTGVPATSISVDHSHAVFAGTAVGAASDAQELTFTNANTTTTLPLVTTLTGPGAGQFTITANTCRAKALAMGDTCKVSVKLAPLAAGGATASLVVSSSATNYAAVALSGAGLAAATFGAAIDHHEFGGTPSATQSEPFTFVVTNHGGQTSGVPAVSFTGDDASQFSVASTSCSVALAPRQSCLVAVRFQPTTVGAKTAALSVTASPGGTLAFPITGTGIANGQLVIIPHAYAFAPITLGEPSTAQTLTVYNAGAVTTSAITLTSGSTEVVLSASTCTTLAPAAACTVTATWTPTTAGLREAAITATATTGGTATASLPIYVRPRLELIAIDDATPPATFDYGAQSVGRTSAPPLWSVFTVRNNTSTTQTLQPIQTQPTLFTPSGAICDGAGAIAAHGTCSIGVAFFPAALGPVTGTQGFSIGAGATESVSQALSGTGIAALRWDAIDGVDFDDVTIGANATHTFVLIDPIDTRATSAITVSITGDGFSIASTTCTSLQPGQTCAVTVKLAPIADGPAMGTLTATATTGGIVTLDLAGNGVAP
ncbi:MAG TPA: choice-of-anchor D domain-containing protein [Kofleriaceae bacterium]|jgi:hypothetical protein